MPTASRWGSILRARRLELWALGIFALALAIRLWNLSERMTHCDDVEFLLLGLEAGNPLSAGWRVASGWTYAPGQFILGWPLWGIPLRSGLFVSDAEGWKWVLFLARFPSAVSGALGVGVLAWLLGFCSGKSWKSPSVGLTALLALFGMRALLDSQQGYSYAVTFPLTGLIAASLCVGARWPAAPLIVNAIACWFSYQFLTLFPVTFAVSNVFLLSYWKRAHSRKSLILANAVAGVAALLIVAPLFYYFVRFHIQAGRSVPEWASFEVPAGPLWEMSDPFGSLVRAVRYMGSTLVRITGYGLTPFWPEWIGHGRVRVLGMVGLLIWAGGAVAVLRGALSSGSSGLSEAQRKVGLFCLGAIGILLLGNMMGKFPLGSTRHSHILFFPLLFLFSLGLSAWGSFFPARARPVRFALAGIAGLLVIGGFFKGYSTFHEQTRNRVNVAEIVDQAKLNRATHVFGVMHSYDNLIAQKASQGALFASAQVRETEGLENALADLLDNPARRGRSVILYSHRSDPAPVAWDAIRSWPPERKNRLRFESLQAIPPVGGNELLGNINGGNGFYLQKVSDSFLMPAASQ